MPVHERVKTHDSRALDKFARVSQTEYEAKPFPLTVVNFLFEALARNRRDQSSASAPTRDSCIIACDARSHVSRGQR